MSKCDAIKECLSILVKPSSSMCWFKTMNSIKNPVEWKAKYNSGDTSYELYEKLCSDECEWNPPYRFVSKLGASEYAKYMLDDTGNVKMTIDECYMRCLKKGY